MLWTASHLIGYTIEATDGSIGSVDDLLFEDRHWTIRWLVVDIGTWLSGRKALLPPSRFGEPDAAHRAFPMQLTRDQVRGSPDLDTDAPVSRQMEERIYDYYRWDPYWLAVPFGGPVPPSGLEPRTAGTAAAREAAGSKPGMETARSDLHLRATREVTGYYVHAADGDIGHIDDFLVDSEDWTIRYAVVDTKNWWPGKKVLIAPQWLKGIDWAAGTVRANMTREAIRNAPEYNPSVAVDRAYEAQLWRHYDVPGYWA